MAIDLSRNTRRLMSDSPLSAEIAEFADWLQAQRYTDFVIGQHIRRLVFVAPRFRRCRGSRSLAAIRAAFDPERRPRSRWHCFAGTRRVYERFLMAQGRLQVPPRSNRFEALRQQYADYLIDVRGLSQSARLHHGYTVADFLDRALRPRQRLKSLARCDVDRFILLRSKEISRHSLQHTIAHVRAFLRYAHHHGHLPERLDPIDAPCIYRGELPPRAMPWSVVTKLLASIDPDSKAGRRDLCILHLASHYGLRPSELVALRTDSIDWQARLLRVFQSKTRSQLQLPLAQHTLRLLRDYVRHAVMSDASDPKLLFHRVRCPYDPLQRTAISDIFAKRAREAGLSLPGKHVYRLRHSFAMRLLARGVGVKAIGDVLGHRSLESTCAYLRLDLTALRGVALQVPGGSTRTGGDHA